MYDQFTDGARKAMQLANAEAERYQCQYIGAEHILLGLIQGTGVAMNVLRNLDVDLKTFRLELEKISAPGPDASAEHLPEYPRAKKVIENAIAEARRLKHNYIGTEHLLLGVLRDGDSRGAKVLLNLGLELNRVRAEVLNLLGHTLEPLDSHRSFEPPEIFYPELQHLPRYARAIVDAFDCQLAVIAEEKEQAVAEQAWEKAATLRDTGRKLKKIRDEFIDRWPKPAN